MREIGGYFELETFSGEHYHKNAIALNCGRGCIRYLIELRGIKNIWIPDYICDSVSNTFLDSGVKVLTYRIKEDFLPDYSFEVKGDEWLFLCDYYGQLTDRDIEFAKEFSHGRIICDETQNFFRKPCSGVDTIYSCRKWFGVADGGYLITGDGSKLDRDIPIDESHNRMSFVLGRYERRATEFFEESKKNNDFFDKEPAKRMSPITENILKGINYLKVSDVRGDNWKHLDSKIKDMNLLCPLKPKVPFMYPFLVSDAGEIRMEMARNGVFIPTLWPNVCREINPSQIAFNYSKNILPLPIDQRYTADDLGYLVRVLKKVLDNNEVE